jgi:hypothetical protein
MSIRNKSKDHLKEHAGVALVAPIEPPQSDDPLKFRTGHPTESTLVEPACVCRWSSRKSAIRMEKEDGQEISRAVLNSLLELAPAIQARLTLATKNTCVYYLKAMRKLWRVFDKLESTKTLDETSSVGCLKTVRDLTPLHERPCTGTSSTAPDLASLETYLTIPAGYSS